MSVFIIAEAGVNHNGDLDLAMELVAAAADAGADAVKFQTFSADAIAVADAPKAEYQMRTTSQLESQLDMLKTLELPKPWHFDLKQKTESLGLVFLSTAFDLGSLAFLVDELGIDKIKIPSGELTNGPLLLAAARSGLDVIISTGMASLEDVDAALGVLAFGFTTKDDMPSLKAFTYAHQSSQGQTAVRKKVTILQCTTEYPSDPAEANLRVMDTFSRKFGTSVGFSDHTPGIDVSIAAVACGASLIEKHFTMSRDLPGPDHKASLEPDELSDLINAIRTIEKSLGDGVKVPAHGERKNIDIARRSLVAGRTLRAGDKIGPDDILAKRPGTGLSPMFFWDVVGSRADRDYAPDEPISLSIIE